MNLGGALSQLDGRVFKKPAAMDHARLEGPGAWPRNVSWPNCGRRWWEPSGAEGDRAITLCMAV
jgi:hypothetical protein